MNLVTVEPLRCSNGGFVFMKAYCASINYVTQFFKMFHSLPTLSNTFKLYPNAHAQHPDKPSLIVLPNLHTAPWFRQNYWKLKPRNLLLFLFKLEKVTHYIIDVILSNLLEYLLIISLTVIF
jgi:hypothetical protein